MLPVACFRCQKGFPKMRHVLHMLRSVSALCACSSRRHAVTAAAIASSAAAAGCSSLRRRVSAADAASAGKGIGTDKFRNCIQLSLPLVLEMGATYMLAASD